MLTFSQLPNKYIISNQTKKFIKSGQIERRRKREREREVTGFDLEAAEARSHGEGN